MSYIKDRIQKLKQALTNNYTKDDCNVILQNTSDVTEILKNSIGNKPYRIPLQVILFLNLNMKKQLLSF